MAKGLTAKGKAWYYAEVADLAETVRNHIDGLRENENEYRARYAQDTDCKWYFDSANECAAKADIFEILLADLESL